MMFRIVAVAICIGMFAQDASAWGQQARQAIALAALQLVRREVPDAFIAGEINYEQDLMSGAVDGAEIFGDDVPLYIDVQTVDAVGTEIQILREARARGAGSHFAYRMGVLSALVSDVILPFGFSYTEEEDVLRDQIRADLEKQVRAFSYSPLKGTFHYVRSPRLFFDAKRSFFHDDRRLLADEYARGRGYDGFLAEAGPVYFDRAVQAVADVWYTVFLEQGSPTDVKPSTRQLSFYYIDEIAYLLEVMKSMQYADRAYKLFEEINPSLWLAYVEIGDLFYEFGSEEGKLRAVEEWKIAQGVPGKARRLASQRLGAHFISEGERLFLRSLGPDALESDLPDALRSFGDALRFDRTNNEAARRISETSVAINERRQKYELQQRFIDNAMGIIKFAERSRMDKDFASAITSYNQALNLVELITPDFKNLHATGRETSSTIRKDIKSVISEVLDTASDTIERGDGKMLDTNYDEAINFYQLVERIVDVIPAEEGSINEQRKQDLIDTANGQISEARLEKKRRADALAPRPAAAPPRLGSN